MLRASDMPHHYAPGGSPRLKLLGIVFAVQIGSTGPIRVGHTTTLGVDRFIAEQQRLSPWPLRKLCCAVGTSLNKQWCATRLRQFEVRPDWFRLKPAVVSLLREIDGEYWCWPSMTAPTRRIYPDSDRKELAFRIVRAAALPIVPGELVQQQIRRAAVNLGYPPDSWRITGAWYKAGGTFGDRAWAELVAAAEARSIDIAELSRLIAEPGDA